MFLKHFVRLGLVAYVFLNVADWVQTYLLLETNSEAFESNPLAASCLHSCGWGGLAVYKAAAVLVFGAAVYILARRRPPVAAGVVTLGLTVLLSVNVYSHNLLASDGLTAEQREEKQRWLDATETLEEPVVVTADCTGESEESPEAMGIISVTPAAEVSPEVPADEPVITVQRNVEAFGEQSRYSDPSTHGHSSH